MSAKINKKYKKTGNFPSKTQRILVFFIKSPKETKKSEKSFKNPLTKSKKDSIIDKLNKARPVGQAVKTLASHAENMGSIPVRVTNKKRQALLVGACLFLLRLRRDRPALKICDFQNRGSHLLLGDRQACLPGVERANIRLWRNSRVGIAARDIVFTDYTFFTNCKYHLLARQDTAYAVCETLLRRFRVGSLVGRSKFPYGCFFFFLSLVTRTLIKPSDVRRMGSHTPPEDRRACSSGAGCGYIHL